jgi:hypothetical protein
VFPDDASDQESLCIKADMRMYDFKRGAEARLRFAAKAEAASVHLARHDSETARF